MVLHKWKLPQLAELPTITFLIHGCLHKKPNIAVLISLFSTSLRHSHHWNNIYFVISCSMNVKIQFPQRIDALIIHLVTIHSSELKKIYWDCKDFTHIRSIKIMLACIAYIPKDNRLVHLIWNIVNTEVMSAGKSTPPINKQKLALDEKRYLSSLL